MTKPPIPANEKERLAALRALLLLDTPPEERFDKITAFATTEFAMPIAAISLVDEDRLWFKSTMGLPICETGRETSFCTHGIVSPNVMLVPDLTKDARFADNPFVVGDAHIRFYAGAPLVLASGHVAGMLCVMDREPREFDSVDCAILSSLRDLVVGEIEPSTDDAQASIEDQNP